MSQKVTVQLDGISRFLAKRKEVQLTVAPNATWRDVITALAHAAPALVGDVITKDKRDLVGTLNCNGKDSIQDLDATADLSGVEFLMIVEEAC
jgi:hypothetical protein